MSILKRINFRKIIAIVLILAVVIGLGAFLIPKVIDEMNGKPGTTSSDSGNNDSDDNDSGFWNFGGNKDDDKDVQTVKISIDEWIGYDSLLQANGGTKTTKDSIYGKMGLNIEFVVTNDANVSSAALIKGDIQGAGYTVNRYAFLNDKFKNAKVDVVMPYITNYSNGGDGIIAKSTIKSVENLAGKKIGVPRFSEAQTLVEWLIANSSLTEQQQKQIRSAMVFFDTPDEAAKAFFAGEVDAAATWEPYLTQAKTTTNARVLFDTSMSRNLILSGVIFRQDFADNNEEFIKLFIDGALQASKYYKKEFKAIRQLPMFELMSDEEIIDMANGADLTTCTDNLKLLTGEAVTMFRDMSNIWIKVGEKAHPDDCKTAFTDKYMKTLESKYSTVDSQATTKDNFSDEKKDEAENIDNKEALMSKKLDIKFQPDSVAISEESYATLNEFAEVAKVLDGVFIQIEGNTAKVAGSDGKDFSKKRANSVAKYLQSQGVDSSRFIIVGNGDTKPIGDNNTEAGKALNRRTDVYFKVVGY